MRVLMGNRNTLSKIGDDSRDWEKTAILTVGGTVFGKEKNHISMENTSSQSIFCFKLYTFYSIFQRLM